MESVGAGAPPPKRPRGRPPSGNPPAKRAYSLDRAKREGTRVYLLDSFPSWVQQKKEFETSSGDGEAGKKSSHAEFANHLLKHHSDRLCRLCKRSYQISVETQTNKDDTLPDTSTIGSAGNDDRKRMSSTPHTSKARRQLVEDYMPSPIVQHLAGPSNQHEDIMEGCTEESDLSDLEIDDALDSYRGDDATFGKRPDDEETAESEVFHFDTGSCDQMLEDESVDPHSGEASSDEIDDAKCIVSLREITKLLQNVYGANCSKCSDKLIYSTNPIGTAVIFKWSCSNGHVGVWHSQPRFSNMFSGNIQFPSAVVLSGNNFSKMALFFKFCKIHFVSSTTFFRVQRLYVSPSVKDEWRTHQSSLFESLKEQQLCVAGDGRTDSPGHCAQYCTYSFMDTSGSKILHVDVVDVRETGGKSTNMERLAFERGLDYLMANVNVTEVVTDAHVQTTALIKNCEKYENVEHSIDVWHGAKNFVKKVIALSQMKGNEDLRLWIPAIRNHFWHCSRECAGDVLKLKALWWSMLHHIVNEHDWVLSIDGSIGKCQHGELDPSERNKPWLKKDSPPHAALRKAMTNKRFLNMLPYYKNFKHTGNLESFHNHMLMYASKRCSYSFEGYVTRMLLSAIDHNYHSDREYAAPKDVVSGYRQKYSKRTRKWAPERLKVAKDYGYIPNS
ncbi:hypothetical protein BSL78_27382 [Apostichopus japonicus]|uniref:Uncharacterized protein n=1 Tax=Stichopus japonicus TaxID=307972 RepID=A0A2G8JJ72_STIJA|nr:hypothetical protein BSL78_27382 [Apostichopus japonicus]